MKFDISPSELCDLQTSLRRAKRWTEDCLTILEPEPMPETRKILQSDLARFDQLHAKLEACFDEHYPPPTAA
jgi:hypothetical protein